MARTNPIHKQLADDAAIATGSDESKRHQQLEDLAQLTSETLQDAANKIAQAQTALMRLEQVLTLRRIAYLETEKRKQENEGAS